MLKLDDKEIIEELADLNCPLLTELLTDYLAFQNDFDNSDYVGMYHFINERISPWTVPKKCFAQTVDVEFEGELFKAPIGYDEYLTTRYGDYMTPPPEAERYVHSMSAYWKE